MDDANLLYELSFESEHRLPDQIDSDRSLAKLEVFPSSARPWTYTLLSVFLNELGDFTKPKRRGVSIKTEFNRQNVTFAFFHETNSKFFIKVIIDYKIIVFASTEWLKRKWTRKSIVEFSDLRKDGKHRVHPITQNLEFFSLNFNRLTEGTKSLYYHNSLIFCSHYDFSNIFHYFAKHIVKVGLHQAEDTSSIHEYNDLYVCSAKNPVNSLEKLKENVCGYLSFDVQENVNKKRLETITIEGKTFYITGGVYISPFAKSILSANDTVKGLILDTTWKIMPFYVTSILMGSFMNIGFPLGFAFGNSEDKSLYERHFKAYSAQTGIDISKFVIESDQGTALKAVCDDKNITHLACMRHLLVSLKFSIYSYVASELIKCSSLLDLHNALTEFSNRFAKINNEDDIAELNKVLAKIGMSFEEDCFNLIDSTRWEQVSMLARINYRMPSTTNSLEASHGHLNKKTPRHNGFWESINRIIESFMMKNHLVNQMIQHNYNQIKTTQEEVMIELQSFYNTSNDHCNCGENKLLSSILDVKIPCSHRLAMGTTFPECPKINLPLSKQWNELIFEYNVLPPINELRTHGENESSKMYAISTIRRFSGYSKRDEIEQYVCTHYNIEGDSFFISGKEVSLIQLIYDGIEHFTEKRNIQRLNKRKK